MSQRDSTSRAGRALLVALAAIGLVSIGAFGSQFLQQKQAVAIVPSNPAPPFVVPPSKPAIEPVVEVLPAPTQPTSMPANEWKIPEIRLTVDDIRPTPAVEFEEGIDAIDDLFGVNGKSTVTRFMRTFGGNDGLNSVNAVGERTDLKEVRWAWRFPMKSDLQRGDVLEQIVNAIPRKMWVDGDKSAQMNAMMKMHVREDGKLYCASSTTLFTVQILQKQGHVRILVVAELLSKLRGETQSNE